jgi:hypothetical protein
MKKILIILIMAVNTYASDSLLPYALNPELVGNNLRDEAALNIFFSANKLERGQIADLQVVDEEASIDLKRNREMRVMKLSNPNSKALKEIRITMSLPVNRAEGTKYPVVFVLPGLYSEKDILYYMNDPGENIVVSYQYPFGNLNPALILQMSKLHELVLAMPAQVAASIRWLKQQELVDASRVSMMGVSLGGHFLPLCQRFLQAQGESLYSSVITYAGIDAEEVFTSSLDKRMGERETKITKQILKVVFTPFEARTHIPYLRGKFYVIYGSEDTFISPASSQKLFELLPEPKQVVAMPGGHINAEAPELIDAFNHEAFSWLQEVGAIQ